jgi:hypothetical protein
LFVFGYAKLDLMFGRTTLEAVRLPYRRFLKPGVRFATVMGSLFFACKRGPR